MHFNHTAISKIHFSYVLDFISTGAHIILSGKLTSFLILESSLYEVIGNFLPYFCLGTSTLLNSRYKSTFSWTSIQGTQDNVHGSLVVFFRVFFQFDFYFSTNLSYWRLKLLGLGACFLIQCQTQLAAKSLFFFNEWREIFNTLWPNTCIHLQPQMERDSSLVGKHGHLVD